MQAESYLQHKHILQTFALAKLRTVKATGGVHLLLREAVEAVEAVERLTELGGDGGGVQILRCFRGRRARIGGIGNIHDNDDGNGAADDGGNVLNVPDGDRIVVEVGEEVPLVGHGEVEVHRKTLPSAGPGP